MTRYNVGARKIHHTQRDIAHAVITADDDRGFTDIIGAGDDPTVPLGADVAYSVDLTPAEAERFRRASNARYVEIDGHYQIAVVDVTPIVGATAVGEQLPAASTLRYMGVTGNVNTTWHGADSTVAVLDGGTTPAVRDRFGWRLIAHRDFVGLAGDPDTITVQHGCWVTPLAVPAGGALVQAVVFDQDGYAYHSGVAAATTWATDNGARVINFSGGGGGAAGVVADAFRYATAAGAVVVCSAGNSGRSTLEYPSRYCETIPGVVSSVAFDETTDTRAPFSNYSVTASGAAPGVAVLTTGADGGAVRASGTSFSSPLMARLVAMGATGGRYCPQRVATALADTARDTPEPDAEEGAGAWHLQRALAMVGTPPDSDRPFPLAAVTAWLDKRYTWTRAERAAKTAIRDWLHT